MVRTMHDRAVSHRDLKAANILLKHAAADPEAAVPVLIDLVGVRVGRRVSFRQRCRELARINASFLNSSLITRGERLRFLRVYLAAGERSELNWKDWWKEIRRATLAKIAKNRRTGRPLA
jgi:serine/threonine protein kinase